MKKKLLLILTILLIIPVIVFAGEGTSNFSFDINVDAPVVGQHPKFVADNNYITVTEETWTNKTDNIVMTKNDVFETNKEYYYELRYKFKASCTIGSSSFESSQYSLGGGGSSGPTDGGYGWGFYTGNKDDLVVNTGDVVINNTNIPKANETITEMNNTYNGHVSFTFGQWVRVEGENEYYDDETFRAGATYKYILHIGAGNGFHFSNDFQVINNAAPEKLVSSNINVDENKMSATYVAIYQVEQSTQGLSLGLENNNPIFPGDTAKIIAYSSSNPTLTWTSLNESVATVNSNGVVTALTPGTATIKATAQDGVSATIDIEVNVRATKISFNNTELILKVGENFTLSNILKINKVPSNALIDPITWSFSDPTVVSFDGNKIYANKVGTTTITATEVGGQQATCEVTVKDGVESIRIEPSYVELYVGEGIQLSAIVSPEPTTQPSYYWFTNSGSITVTNSGYVTAISEGSASVTVETDSGKQARATIVVKTLPTVQSLSFDETELKMNKGDTHQLNLTILPDDAVDKTITWSSNNPAIATVSDTGLVTAKAFGQATITAKSVNGVTTSIVVKIAKNGFIREAFNGSIETFYYVDGVKQKGFKEIEGVLYYFDDATGVLLTGWQTDGTFKWYQKSNGEVVKGIYTIDGKIYYFSNRGYLTTGFVTINDKIYFFSRTYGYALKGWVSNDIDGKWYQKEDGSLLVGIHTIDGKIYYFNEQGKLTTGFVTVNGKIYFFSRNKEYALQGWVSNNVDGKWYQQEDGSLLTGIQIIDGKKYYFGEDGKLVTGFVTLNEKIYFFSRTYGYALKGWVSNDVDGKWYQKEDGSLLTGIQIIDGKKYYFGGDGKLVTGFVTLNGKIYFFSRTYGYALKGWVSNDIDGKWYQQEDGSLLTGIQIIDGKKYYFGEDGKLITGFVTIEGDLYFFSRNTGYALSGWVSNKTEGKWYQTPEGKLLTGQQTIDGKHYYFNDQGKITTGFIEINGKRYFYSRNKEYALQGWVMNDTEGVWYQLEDGSLITGPQTIDGRDYIFGDDGILQGFVTLNGKKYYYNPDGTQAKGVQYMAGRFWQFNSVTGAFEKYVKQIRVIDISTHNGDINWNTVKSSGLVDAVILRLGYGQQWVDNRFIYNKNELERLGIPYSVYLFSYAENKAEALKESNFVINTIRSNNVHIATNIFGIYYDLEDWEIASTGENSYGISKDTYGQMITTFVDNVEKNLCIKTRVYASSSYIKDRFPAYAQNYATWVADWRGYLGYDGPYEGWQYSSKGRIPGINGNVDMNYFYM